MIMIMIMIMTMTMIMIMHVAKAVGTESGCVRVPWGSSVVSVRDGGAPTRLLVRGELWLLGYTLRVCACLWCVCVCVCVRVLAKAVGTEAAARSGYARAEVVLAVVLAPARFPGNDKKKLLHHACIQIPK